MSLNNVQHLHQSFSEEEQKVQQLLSAMTLSEKIGQMSQFSGNEGFISQDLAEAVKAGKVGSVLNEVDVNVVNQLQHIAVNETRLGIPLLIGRDVIHGFKTIMPIPLGQAASWSKDLVKQGAKVAALEGVGPVLAFACFLLTAPAFCPLDIALAFAIGTHLG